MRANGFRAAARLLVWAIAIVSTSGGCNELVDTGRFRVVDAGTDSGSRDAGLVDAGDRDSGEDAGEPDGGPPDAGPDAGQPDAGPPDAGAPDAGTPDAGPPACDPTTRLCGVEEVCAAGAAGAHACARTSAGNMFCWGANGSGQLGRTGGDVSRPTRVEALSAVTDIACGRNHTCAIAGGSTYCWGDNQSGEVGKGDLGAGTDTSIPTLVMGLAGVTPTGVAAGANNSCVTSSDRRLHCWGDNGVGQLGTGVSPGDDRGVAVLIADAWEVDEVSIGFLHLCTRSGGNVACWGNNYNGQLGDGTRDNSVPPVGVLGIADATGIGSADSHNCARRSDGSVWCWGRNSGMELGGGTGSLSSTPIQTLDVTDAEWVQVANHSCAGSPLYCWGSDNTHGELGDGVGSVPTRPVPVVVAPPFTSRLIPGGGFTCALLENGGVACWGLNDHGQLGDDGLSSSRLTPAPVLPP